MSDAGQLYWELTSLNESMSVLISSNVFMVWTQETVSSSRSHDRLEGNHHPSSASTRCSSMHYRLGCTPVQISWCDVKGCVLRVFSDIAAHHGMRVRVYYEECERLWKVLETLLFCTWQRLKSLRNSRGVAIQLLLLVCPFTPSHFQREPR